MAALRQATFWFVWNSDGYAPTFRHPSCESATQEAERLARAHPGNTFVVLESVSSIRVEDVIRIDLRPSDDIPF